MKTIKRGSRGDDVRRWQAFLLMNGYRIGLADGNFGSSTDRATREFQKKNNIKADGIVGNATWKFLPKNFIPILPAIPVTKDRQREEVKIVKVNNGWPKQNYAAMTAFYGGPGENQTQLVLPYPMVLAWDTGTVVKKITCNKKCTESLHNIFEKTLKVYGLEDIKKLKLNLFGGCLNVRKMRGGSSWSIHSWGAAVDLDPNNNQLKWGRDRATFAKKEYNDFWKIVESEGWVSLGKAKNYDWMHFQAAIF